MTLSIELAPDVARKLEEAAEQHGQLVEDYARSVLQSCVEPRTEPPPALLADGLPPEPVEALLTRAHQQGVGALQDPSKLRIDWSDDSDTSDFDVDGFLALRNQAKWEGEPGISPRWSLEDSLTRLGRT